MKSSLRSDEIQDTPWMKSNPSIYNPAKQDFIAEAISSTKCGFHPSKTDLTAINTSWVLFYLFISFIADFSIK